jgi:hypothetical protein
MKLFGGDGHFEISTESKQARDKMTAISQNDSRIILAARWIARIWALGLLLFWGLFFVEHTAEWFANPNRWPPVQVILLHAAHFVFLVGLLIGWRWELIGGLIALVASLVFFSQAGGNNALIFLSFSVIPSLLWIGLSVQSLRGAPTPSQIKRSICDSG